jgi:hypothetical protein
MPSPILFTHWEVKNGREALGVKNYYTISFTYRASDFRSSLNPLEALCTFLRSKLARGYKEERRTEGVERRTYMFILEKICSSHIPWMSVLLCPIVCELFWAYAEVSMIEGYLADVVFGDSAILIPVRRYRMGTCMWMIILEYLSTGCEI